MRILHIHTKMVSGGIEAIVCGLVNELVKTEDVSLCTIFEPHAEDVFYKKVSSQVKKITLGKKNYGFSLKELFSLVKLINRGEYDVVHVHGCFQYYFLAFLLLHKKVRFFYTIHSDAYKENQKWDWRLFKLKKMMFTRRWVVPVTISNASQESFKELYFCNSELIYNGTPKPIVNSENHDLDKYRITENTKLFIHAGRITRPKNQVVLCKVFKHLIEEENQDVALIIAGSPEETYIFDELKTYFSNRIVYLGERNDIPSLFNQSDAFCLPSIWEGLPVTILESLSVGCVPICSPVGGVVDVISDGKNGLLSKSYSEDDYLQTIRRFLSLSPGEIRKIKDNCFASFEKYNMVNTAENYLTLYKREL